MRATPGGVPLTSATSATGSAAAAGPVLGPDRKAARTIRLRAHFTAPPLNNRPMTDGTERHALAAAVADQRKRCPEDRMGMREHGLLLGIDETIIVDQARHRLLQRHRAAERGICRLAMGRVG